MADSGLRAEDENIDVVQDDDGNDEVILPCSITLR
jgi:hypothetical protein